MPTETVYGLAADADNDAAVAQIFKAKGRPADHPLIVHVAGMEVVSHYAACVPEFAKQLMQAFWPGPLTLILPRRPGVATAAAGGNDTIGLRCPSHPVAQALLRQLLNGGQTLINSQATSENAKQLESDPHCFFESNWVWGLAAPSANKFGRVSPTTAQHVADEFGEALLVLDGGPCGVGIESTIIDCTRGQPVLLRPGVITPEQVQTACGLKVLSITDSQSLEAPTPKASGSLVSHYAPRATVRLMPAPELRTALKLLASHAGAPGECSTIAVFSRAALTVQTPHVLYRRMPGDAVGAAQTLFASLRELDDLGVKLIWIETPPADPDWDGVRDRLQRAAI